MEPRYFAQIENGIVTRTIVADSKEWCESRLGGTWIETFMDREDKKYAGIGKVYVDSKEDFAPPKPHDSFVLDVDKLEWKAPKEMPKDIPEDKKPVWDEKKQDWELADKLQ